MEYKSPTLKEFKEYMSKYTHKGTCMKRLYKDFHVPDDKRQGFRECYKLIEEDNAAEKKTL